jgi:hypothetical protein
MADDKQNPITVYERVFSPEANLGLHKKSVESRLKQTTGLKHVSVQFEIQIRLNQRISELADIWQTSKNQVIRYALRELIIPYIYASEAGLKKYEVHTSFDITEVDP